MKKPTSSSKKAKKPDKSMCQHPAWTVWTALDAVSDTRECLTCGKTEVRSNVIQYNLGSSLVEKPPVLDPIEIRINCPECHVLHVDTGIWATKPHHTHACQHCGHTWRPAVVDTVGVQFLPGFKNEVLTDEPEEVKPKRKERRT